MNALLRALKSKTVWGVAIVQGAALAAGGPVSAVAVAAAVGKVVAAAGARDAVSKAAQVVGAALAGAGDSGPAA